MLDLRSEGGQVKRISIWTRLWALLFLSLLVGNSFAQVTTGTLSGVVTDQTGMPIEAAQVNAQQKGDVNFDTAVTDAKGRYVFPNLSPGVYTIRIEAQGYNPATQSDVSIRLGAKVRINYSLKQTMEVKQEVTVTANAPVVETTKTAVDQNISFEQFKDIPAQGRDFNSIIRTFAGVNSWNNNFNVFGSRDNQNNFLIDGMKNNELGDTQTAWHGGYARSLYGYADPTKEAEQFVQSLPGAALGQFNFDSIEEIQVATTGYSAEHGQGSGAVFNMVTRSGSDKFKFGFTVNHQTDKINKQTANPYPLKRWQESLFFGGPIIEGKLRFFISYERDDYFVGFDDRVVNAGNLNLWVKDLDIWRSEQAVNRITGKLTYVQSEKNKFSLTANYFGDGSLYRNTQWRPAGNIEEREGTNRGFSLLVSNQRQFKNGLLQVSAKYSSIDRFTGTKLGGDNLELRPEGDGFDFWIRRVGTLGPTLDVGINSLQFKSTYNWFLKDKAGDHNILFGIDYEHYRQKTDLHEWNYVAFWNIKDGEIIPAAQDTWYLWFVQVVTGVKYTLPLSQAALYVNEDWRVNSRLTLGAGLRGDWDEFIKKFYLSPRISMALDPFGDGKTVLRAGTGIFRDRADLLPFAKSQQERGYNLYFNNGGPFTSDPADLITWKKYMDRVAGGRSYVGNLYERDPNLQPPITYEANIGFERDLFQGFVLSANYVYKKMDKLFYEQRFNYFQLNQNGQWVQPDPTKPTIFRLTNIGSMRANDLEFILTKKFRGGSFINMSYVFEKTRGNSSRALAFWFESYFNQTGNEKQFYEFKAPADFEVRNFFKASWSFMLPLDIIFSGFVQARSGKPLTVYENSNYPVGWRLPEGPNSRRLPPFSSVDIRLSKRVKIKQYMFQVYADFFNLLNRDNVLSQQGAMSAANFLTALSYGQPRQAQIGFRFEWN
jgi:hypothetical protein